VSTRQQTTPSDERGSLWQTWWDIVEEEGWTGLWKGLKPSLVLVVNPAITYGAFEKIKKWFLARSGGKSLSALEVFLVGALAKTAATLITYPYIMAKVRLQWKPPKNAEGAKQYERYTGAVDVLKKVWKKDGLKGLYNGMDAQIYKAVLSQALLLMLKEKLTVYTLILFAFFNQRKLRT
ncbi:mitochondrial carrier, partial [Basidiobolus meristosporus CBS 931.73]